MEGMITRRAIIAGLAAPAIVRASSLMPIRGLLLAVPDDRPRAGFVERLCFHWMDQVLKTGWTPEAARPFGGMSEQRMRRAVAYAWRHGFLT